MIGEDELSVFFDDFARAIEWTHNSATVTIMGIFDEGEDPRSFDKMSTDYVAGTTTIRCASGDITGMVRGDEISLVDPLGTTRSFVVGQNPEKEADGATSIVYLREVSSE